MLIDALRRFRTAPDRATMIGDSLRDLQAAQGAGAARILVRTGHGAATQAAGLPREILPVAVHDDLAAAVAALLDGGA
jgi:D-glycero-D-manno-heptose 1,7-bisphosphate phosphatase